MIFYPLRWTLWTYWTALPVTSHSPQCELFIQNIREEFRSHLENLFSLLHLAPPYHSIEKAIQLLANTLRTKPHDFQHTLAQDMNFKWDFFREIYVASGLNRKHRGIIAHFMKTCSSTAMPDATFQFLKHHPDFPKSWTLPSHPHSMLPKSN